MKKDKEWAQEQINYYKECVGTPWDDYTRGLNVGYRDAETIINQLEEPEKTIIPQFVADFIEKQKKNDISLLQFGYGYFGKNISDPKVYEWVDRNEDKFIKAYLNGYEVEKEKRYRLRLTAPILTRKKYLNKIPGGKRYFVGNSKGVPGDCQTIFTESELEKIDETGFVREEAEETE